MRYLSLIFLFLGIFFVAPILAQSIPRPVAGTMYAPVYVASSGEFVGWEGSDGTFITNQGQFFPSVDYTGVSVIKLPCIYTVNFNVETFEILDFKLGNVQCSVDGTGLPSISLSEQEYDSGTPYVFESSEDEDYPMPPSGKDENGQFTQRVFLRLFPDEPFTSTSERASHLALRAVTGWSSGETIYYGAGPSPVMMAHYDFVESLIKPRVEVVSYPGDSVAKDGFEFLVCESIETDVSYYLGRIYRYPSHSNELLDVHIGPGNGSGNVVINGVSYRRVLRTIWTTVSYSNVRLIAYGNFERALFKFYLRDQYQNYKTGVSYVASLHKRMNGYEIWYFDRKYYAAGYNNSNSDGSGSDNSPPTLPSPPTELSGFKYFSKDEDGKYHLNISGVLNNFKTKLKEKYKFNFLGVGDDVSGDSVGDFQSGLASSIEEVKNSEPFSVEVEHTFDIVKGDFRSPSISVKNTKLIFDYQKWFDVEILHVIRCIILYALCIEFFFMSLKLFV